LDFNQQVSAPCRAHQRKATEAEASVANHPTQSTSFLHLQTKNLGLLRCGSQGSPLPTQTGLSFTVCCAVSGVVGTSCLHPQLKQTIKMYRLFHFCNHEA
jgi:hypothetical protein